MTDLIAELAEVVRLDGKATSGKWSVEAEGKNEFGQLEFAIEIYDGKCPIVGSGWFYGDPHDANIASAAVNFLRTHHAELTRILTDDAAIRAAHHDLVIRLGEVTTRLEAAEDDVLRWQGVAELSHGEMAERMEAARKDARGERDETWEVWQDDMPVAVSDSLPDALHYLAMYQQDGPVTLKRAVVYRETITPEQLAAMKETGK